METNPELSFRITCPGLSLTIGTSELVQAKLETRTRSNVTVMVHVNPGRTGIAVTINRSDRIDLKQ